MSVTNLRITSAQEIPADVLVEHIAYSLRETFRLSGPFNVEITQPKSFSQRFVEATD